MSRSQEFWAIKLKTGVWQGLPDEPEETKKSGFLVSQFIEKSAYDNLKLDLENQKAVAKSHFEALQEHKKHHDKAIDVFRTLLALSHHSIEEEKWRIEEVLKEFGEL